MTQVCGRRRSKGQRGRSCAENGFRGFSSPPSSRFGGYERTAAAPDQAANEAKEKAARDAGVEAVVYGLPIAIMDIAKAKATSVVKPEGFAAPVNQFVEARSFPDASFKDIARPNVDTLYSSAFPDLSAEPIVLSVPDTHGRYYLMPILDAWTNTFASPGKDKESNWPPAGEKAFNLGCACIGPRKSRRRSSTAAGNRRRSSRRPDPRLPRGTRSRLRGVQAESPE